MNALSIASHLLIEHLKTAASAGTRAAKKAVKKAAPAKKKLGRPRRPAKATGLTVRLSVALPSGTELVYASVASLKADADVLAAAAKEAGS